MSDRVCSRCVMDTSDPWIRFDEDGECQYCGLHDQLESEYPLGDEGTGELEKIAAEVRHDGRDRAYDCVIGVSGGTDSTYQLLLAKELGLRPLAVHFDNGWNSEIAVANIQKATTILGFDFYTYVVDWEEFRDLQIAFLLASTPDGEIPTDIGIKSTLFRAAARERIRWVVNGHSFRTEGKVPVLWSYGDGRYIKAVHRQFGTRKLKTFPNYMASDFLRFTFWHRLQQFRLLYYVPYDKPAVKKLLANKLGWQDYGGHHYESIYTRFYQGYVLPRKFGIDKRKREFSALARTGTMTRSEALQRLAEEPPLEPEIAARDRAYVIKKLRLTEDEFEAIMSAPARTFLEFPNYYGLYSRMRGLIGPVIRLGSRSKPLIMYDASRPPGA